MKIRASGVKKMQFCGKSVEIAKIRESVRQKYDFGAILEADQEKVDQTKKDAD